MIEIDDSDTNTIVVVKLSITLLTVIVMGWSIIKTGLRILKQRKKSIGFMKGK